MASITLRSGVYRAQVARKGVRTTGTFDTKREAQNWAIRTEAGILDGSIRATAKAATAAALKAKAHRMVTAVAPVAKTKAHPMATAADLFDRYSREISPAKGGARWEQLRLAKLQRDSLFKRPLSDLDAPAMAGWRDARLCQVAASTVNRELNVLSAVFNIALKEWRPVGLVANPVRAIMRPRNPVARTQRVSADDQAAIVAKLGWDRVTEPKTASAWTAFAFTLAIETAMRRGEIHNIQWRYVDLAGRYIFLPVTKNGHSRRVPLSSRAIGLLQLLTPGEPGELMLQVAYNTCGTLYRRAAKAAGLEKVHFHDARREATTNFSKRVANVLELAAITGHRSLSMLNIYYQPDIGDLSRKLG